MRRELINLLKIYAFTWLLICLWGFIVIYIKAGSFDLALDRFSILLEYRQFYLFIHLVFVVFYLLFLIIRYFIRVQKVHGFKVLLKRLMLRLVLPIMLLIFGSNYILSKNAEDHYQYSWNSSFENLLPNATDFYASDNKHRGMTIFGFRRNNSDAINTLIKNNVEWVAYVPFIDQKNETSDTLYSGVKEVGQWRGRDSISMSVFKELQDKNIKIMLKPHLWIHEGWRSNIHFETDKQWENWFAAYKKNILHFATLAQSCNIELFCLGTEFSSSIKRQPELWKALIKEIKGIYKGKLTYAANWYDEYEYIDFWDELDYIGIQAYFPLTTTKNPELLDIQNGWLPHKEKLKALSERYDKPILFTEIGYRSDATSTIEPWEWNSISNMATNQRSTRTQQLAFEAMFNTFWDEPWFAGTYIWQWDKRTTKESAEKSFDFTPRFKPAENTIAKWYGNYNSLQE